jgi:hypothetical protein
MANTILENLLEVLALERSAILLADFEVVATTGAKKIALLEELSTAKTDSVLLKTAKKSLTHNQALLAAAISGISAAHVRLPALAKVRGGLSTYNQSGQMSQVPIARPVVERKA